MILHMDMDAFYASVEQLDNPGYRGRPVIVGGPSKRGVVSTASYEARKHGVHSAMPIFQAKKKCPDGIFVPVRMGRYRELSTHVMGILQSFSPIIEQVSIDEAYMDLSGTERLLGPPKDIGLAVKQRIREETSLTCSIGLAPNKFLAKIASDMEKPGGLTIILPEEVPCFIKELPLEKIPGVGKKAILDLHRMGAFRLGDIKHLANQALLKADNKFSQRIMALAQGIDESPVTPCSKAKSISSENTLNEDTNKKPVLKKHLLFQSEIVGKRLREKQMKALTVTLKLKRSDFKQMTRNITVNEPIHTSQSIYELGCGLLDRINLSARFRLIGIGVANLVAVGTAHGQMALFNDKDNKGESWEDAEKAMDTIKDRFGKGAIKRGGLL